jgi:hypothetical protein
MGHFMDVEKSIADIAFLEELYALPDERKAILAVVTDAEDSGGSASGASGCSFLQRPNSRPFCRW